MVKSAPTGRRRQKGTHLESFEDWYEREHARMVATLLLATGDIELASDGVDEACARALARWPRVSAMAAPTGWAYRVALNHARRVARRRRMERIFLRRVQPPPNCPPLPGRYGPWSPSYPHGNDRS